jgi:hypothetical protein
MGGVASDVFERMVTRGALKNEDFRIIYKSPIFPTSSFAYAHDLKPDLAKKLTECFFAFRFPESMQKEFNGDDRFFPSPTRRLGKWYVKLPRAPAHPTTKPPTTPKPNAKPKRSQRNNNNSRPRRNNKPTSANANGCLGALQA